MSKNVSKSKINKAKLVVALVLVGLIAIGSFVFFSKDSDTEVTVTATEARTTTAEHDPNSADHPTTDASGVTDLTGQAQVVMDIKDFKYTKANIKISKGTTVTWTNRDDIQHNVMAEHDDDDAAHDAPTAGETKSSVLAGPLLNKGESYSFTFNNVDDTPYHCSPHPDMKGSVTVVE